VNNTRTSSEGSVSESNKSPPFRYNESRVVDESDDCEGKSNSAGMAKGVKWICLCLFTRSFDEQGYSD